MAEAGQVDLAADEGVGVALEVDLAAASPEVLGGAGAGRGLVGVIVGLGVLPVAVGCGLALGEVEGPDDGAAGLEHASGAGALPGAELEVAPGLEGGGEGGKERAVVAVHAPMFPRSQGSRRREGRQRESLGELLDGHGGHLAVERAGVGGIDGLRRGLGHAPPPCWASLGLVQDWTPSPKSTGPCGVGICFPPQG